MSAWKPGDVALILVGGTEHVALRDSDEAWLIGDSLAYRVLRDSETRLPTVSVIRPLVVIDPESNDVERLQDLFWQNQHHSGLAMQAALREFANPTPPKPDEPQGLGAVVRDAQNELWIRTCYPCDDCLNKPWQRGPVRKNWQIVDAVEVLAEGYDQGAGEPLADWERDFLRGES